MNGLETAIRNALERSGNPDAEQRSRVYQSARAAAEKAFRAQEESGQASSADIAAQRAGIEEIISAIERDQIERERQASPADAAVPLVSLDGVTRTEPSLAPEPSVSAIDAPRAEPAGAVPPIAQQDIEGRGSEPPAVERPAGTPVRPVSGDDLSIAVARDDGFAERQRQADNPPAAARSEPGGRRWFRSRRKVKAERSGKEVKPRRKRSGLLGLVVQLCLLFGFVALGLWFISLNGGLEQTGRNLLESGAGMVSGQGGGGSAGQRVGAGQFSGEWTVAFEPDGDGAPVAGGAVEFEEIEDQGRPALRITSVSAGEDGELRIPLGEAAIEMMQAGPVLLALTVRSAGDEPTQIYVRCEIAGVREGCGRRRFDVSHESVDILFDLDAQAMSGGDAQLILNSDVNGEGKPVTLFSVRLQAAADA